MGLMNSYFDKFWPALVLMVSSTTFSSMKAQAFMSLVCPLHNRECTSGTVNDLEEAEAFIKFIENEEKQRNIPLSAYKNFFSEAIFRYKQSLNIII